MTLSKASQLMALAERVASGSGISNSLDGEIEIALFDPPEDGFVSVRRNSAASKLIYTHRNGWEETHWPANWTMDRPGAACSLRDRAHALLDKEPQE